MAREFCEGSGDAALDPPAQHSLNFGVPSIASAHIPHGQGERAECAWCFQVVYINLDGTLRRHYEPMTKHKHRWDLDVLDVIYDEPDEDGGRVPEPLRSLLHLSDSGGDRIVVHCRTGSHVGVWPGDVDSPNWQPTHDPRWTVPLTQYDRAQQLAEHPPAPAKPDPLAAGPIPAEPPTLHKTIDVRFNRAGETLFEGRVMKHAGAE